MANDLQELCDTVSEDLAEVDSADTIVTTKIKKAIALEETTPYWFNELRQTVPTVAGTRGYTFTLKPLSHFLVRISPDGTVWNPMNGPMPYAEFESLEHNVTAQRALPTDYAITEDTFRVWPTPDAVYTIECHALVQLAALTTASSTNAWTNEAKHLIAAKACELLCREYLRDFERAEAFRASADSVRRKLADRTHAYKSDGRTAKAFI